MQFLLKYRLPAIFCACAVLICDLVSRPFASIGVGDDGPYILMAQTLASTGHILYNGGEAAMILFQLYLGAAFIKLFGFSFTTVRMSTLLIAAITASLVQRTLVRTGISERNASLGTLAFVLSPLYLVLSSTFMSDISGVFAVGVCFYGCIRALQASTDRSSIAWLCFAVIANAISGTSRQISWLGILIMLPSTVWLLRSRRRVLLGGTAATFAGMLFVYACVDWLKRQPYIIPVPLFISNFPLVRAVGQLALLLLDLPFLLLPVFILFLPELRKCRLRNLLLLSSSMLAYLYLAFRWRASRRLFEPTSGNLGGWIGTHGVYEGIGIRGAFPVFLPGWLQVLLTVVCLAALAGLLRSLLHARRGGSPPIAPARLSWKQLALLVVPFASVNILLLLANSNTTHTVFDRYAFELVFLALPCLVRFHQERMDSRLPGSFLLVVGVMALYSIVNTHNTFALERARVAINAEMAAHQVPAAAIDNGWDYNFDVELQYADHINDPRITVPANSYTTVRPPPATQCQVFWYDRTPHIHPIYGVSFDPNACYGPAPFAPVHYSRWLAASPGTLYVVKYIPDSKQ